jgi:DNA-binding CsgD family transcriptional regulator
MELTLSHPQATPAFVHPLGAMPAAHARAPEPLDTTMVLMRVLDQLDYGVMIVNDSARVRFANRVAIRDCTSSTHAIRVSEGHLHARVEREQQGLMRALAASRSGRRSLVTFTSQEPLVSVAIVPVHESEAGSAESQALVVFGRRQVCEPLSVEFFAREHRLTSAETGVLRGVTGGMRPAQIAREAGVAMSTVRTQITSIRMKTGARSIGELVRLVTVLPPIVPVLAN